MTDNNRPPRRPPSRPSGPDRRRPAAIEPREDARVAKVMARAGLCSRRDAEGWIAAGRVAVNGKVIDSPALNVGERDRITIDGIPLPERPATRLFLFHKPRGVVTTSRDPEGRPTIFDVLPQDLPRVVTIGRLDINTEGLLLLTNDGGLARTLELPATGWIRRYRVRANGTVTQPQLDELSAGITIEGVDYAGIDARLDRVQGANLWLTMGLTEGKNREIKRVLEHLGLAVTRLIRLSYGPFQLGDLAAEAVEPVPTRVLRDQLGDNLARQVGLEPDVGHEPRAARARAPVAVPVRSTHQERLSSEPRAHVSAMRSARQNAAGEGRRRTERGATADRKGRAVAVERVSSTVPREERHDTRNARRFTRETQASEPGAGRLDGTLRRTRPASAATRTRPDRENDAAPRRGRAVGAKPAGSRADRTSRDDRRPPRPAEGARERPSHSREARGVEPSDPGRDWALVPAGRPGPGGERSRPAAERPRSDRQSRGDRPVKSKGSGAPGQRERSSGPPGSSGKPRPAYRAASGGERGGSGAAEARPGRQGTFKPRGPKPTGGGSRPAGAGHGPGGRGSRPAGGPAPSRPSGSGRGRPRG